MSTDHNRIKVADLEKNEQNKILTTNTDGELEFSEINFASTEYVDTKDDLKVDKVAGERLINASEITNLSNQSGVNTGDNAVNSNYTSDYRETNFVAGTDYLTPNGSASALTGFPIVSSSISGIVDNTSLQELGGVDKLINGVRIGTGNNNGVNSYVDTNTALGKEALTSATSAYATLAIGRQALTLNTGGNYNTAVGAYSMHDNTTGNTNTALGVSTLYQNTTGSNNTAIGFTALSKATTSNDNTVVGNFSGAQTLGSNNTALGNLSLSTNSSTPSGNTGSLNVTLGSRAGRYITTGTGNIIITSSSSNTGGVSTAISTGSNNVLISPNDSTTGTGITTGSGNTIIGKVTGLAGALGNTVILSDGVGTQRLVSNSSKLTTLPVQTTALITGDATGKAVLTKEYLATRIGTVAPASSADAGTDGEIRVASGYVYWYVTGTGWLRSAGATF